MLNENHKSSIRKYTTTNNLLYYKNPNGDRLVLPRILRETIFHSFHSSPFMGHRGIDTTINRIKIKYKRIEKVDTTKNI